MTGIINYNLSKGFDNIDNFQVKSNPKLLSGSCYRDIYVFLGKFFIKDNDAHIPFKEFLNEKQWAVRL